MPLKSTSSLRSIFQITAVVLFCASPALAQVEINQRKALSGVGRGDSHGYPLILGPGSYKLTSDLIATGDPSLQHAVVLADNGAGVTLDLNGFTIQTDVVAIRVLNPLATIRNGNISAYLGVEAAGGGHVRVEAVRMEVSWSGVATAGATESKADLEVVDCRVRVARNDGIGILAGGNLTAMRNFLDGANKAIVVADPAKSGLVLHNIVVFAHLRGLEAAGPFVGFAHNMFRVLAEETAVVGGTNLGGNLCGDTSGFNPPHGC